MNVSAGAPSPARKPPRWSAGRSRSRSPPRRCFEIAGWVIALFFAACAARLLMNRLGAPAVTARKVILFAAGPRRRRADLRLHARHRTGLEHPRSSSCRSNCSRPTPCAISRSRPARLFPRAVRTLLLADPSPSGSTSPPPSRCSPATLVHFHRGAVPAAIGAAAARWRALPRRCRSSSCSSFFSRASTAGSLSIQPVADRHRRACRTRLSRQAAPRSRSAGIVFRADFPDGNAPPDDACTGAAGVLWQGDGLTWVHGPAEPERRPCQLGGAGVRQRIIVQPQRRALAFRARPTRQRRARRCVSSPAVSCKAGAITSRCVMRSCRGPRIASCVCWPSTASRRPPPAGHSPPACRRSSAPGRRATAPTRGRSPARAPLLPPSRNFLYTLTPGTYSGRHALDQFLFERRKGFCEHYAAAFATLMRLAGIPSRVVIGYHGRRIQRARQIRHRAPGDAHAWCEVWLEGARLAARRSDRDDRARAHGRRFGVDLSAAQTDPTPPRSRRPPRVGANYNGKCA